MMTVEMGVGLGTEDRKRLLRLFVSQVAAKTEEQESLKQEIVCGCEKHGDLCDHAQGEIDAEHMRHRLNVIREDIARIRAVVELLRTGWDGFCVKCAEVSVFPRLNAGYATRRCCACKTAAELKEKRKRVPHSPAFIF